MTTKLNFFVEPLFNESMYSIAARYKRILHLQDTQFVLRSMFDHQAIVIHNDLPSHLSILSERLDGALSVDTLIQRHTAFRYFGHFQTPSRRSSLYMAMAGSPPPAPVNVIGAMSSVIKAPRYLMFCRDCIQNDRSKFGVGYWHLDHQRPGVVICADHQTPLWRSAIERRWARSKHALMDLETTLALPSSQLAVPERQFSLLLTLAQNTRDLFRASLLDESHFESVRAGLKGALYDQGFTTQTGNIRGRSLLDSWSTQIDPALHQLLDCNLHQMNINDYLRLMRRASSTAANPLPTLILAWLLNTSISKLFSAKPAIALAANKSMATIERHYLCRNSMCAGFERQETEPAGFASTKRIGHYCKVCHAVYTHSPNEDKFFWYDRGVPFREKLHLLVSGGKHNASQICSELGIDRYTLIRTIDLLGLSTPWQPLKNIPPMVMGPSRSGFDRRACWLELITKNPFLSTPEISKLDPSLARAIKRYDREWFDLNQSKIAPRRPRGPRRKSSDFDRQLSLKLMSCVTTILDEPTTTKVTQAELERRLDFRGLFSKANKQHFPETLAAAANGLDSSESFSKRRLDQAVNYFVRENFLPTKLQLAEFLDLRERSIAPWNAKMELALQRINHLLSTVQKESTR